MANFKKVFNFREGVQVDDDTFVVNGPLVGIGTSVPTSFLDVRNTAQFTGLITANNMFVGGSSTFFSGLQAGIVSVFSGIVTAASGIISYYGDGSGLFNIPTSQWVDVDTGIGVSSVYNGGNVGIATLNPQYQLQVGGNPEQGFDGFAINYGNAYVSGAVTAFRFVGDGGLLTDLNADELTSGIVTQARIPRLELDKIPLIPDYKLEQNLQISGILTAQGGFIGSLTGQIEGDIISSGFSTFTDVEVTGSLTAVASTALSLQGTPDIRVGLVSANCVDAGIAFTVSRADITGDLSVGVLTVTNADFKVGTDGIEFNVTNGKIGIGTTLATTSEVVILGENNTRLEVVTERGYSALNIGGDLGIGVSTVELRYENQELSLANYADGDFTYHLGRDSATFNGNFRWLKANTYDEIMTLTNQGYLGLGITDPTVTLDVFGDANLNGSLLVQQGSEFLQDVVIYQGLTYNSTSGVATAYDLVISNDLTVNSDAVFNGTVALPDNTNFNTTSGISTFNDLNVVGTLELAQDFNYNTTNGITTVNDFVVTGILSAFNADIVISIQEGISTFNDIDVLGISSFAGLSTFASGMEVFGDVVFVSGDTTPAIIGTGGTMAITTPNIEISDAVSIAGSLAVGSNLYVSGSSFFNETTNLNTTSGISTFNELNVIGFTSASNFYGPLFVEIPEGYGGTGINTISNDVCIGGYLTVGLADTARCVVDAGISTASFFLPPRVASDVRDGTEPGGTVIDQPYEGAVIYNSTLQKLQFYNGTAWETVTSS